MKESILGRNSLLIFKGQPLLKYVTFLAKNYTGEYPWVYSLRACVCGFINLTNKFFI